MLKFLASLTLCAALGAHAQMTGAAIDNYFSSYKGQTPRTVRGALVEQDIFTRGDAEHPPAKGAVLRFASAYVHATLAPGKSTTPVQLTNEQEVYYVTAGTGTATAGTQTVDLYRNIGLLAPANLGFSLKNTGSTPLEMYIVTDPIPEGYRPNSTLLVRDENTIPVDSYDGLWNNIVKMLFTSNDGLGTIQAVLTVTFDPYTIAKPHVVDHHDIEEVWTDVQGDSVAWVGNQLRPQPEGTAMIHIPDNLTPHSNMNPNADEQVKFFFFGRYHPHPARP